MILLIYILVALLILIIGLMIHGFVQTNPSVKNVLKPLEGDDVDVPIIIIFTVGWPILLIVGIIFGLGYLPILLGRYVGKKCNFIHNKKEFKEKINKK